VIGYILIYEKKLKIHKKFKFIKIEFMEGK